MKKVVVTSDEIREQLKTWISEADNETIERIYNENYDNAIEYDIAFEAFIVPRKEAKRCGLSYEPLK